MSAVDLQLPEEIVADLALEAESVRGADDISVFIEGLGAASSFVTLASLRGTVLDVARRIRSWRGDHHQHGEPDPVLTVDGPGLHVEVPLTPNVSAQTIAEALSKALGSGSE